MPKIAIIGSCLCELIAHAMAELEPACSVVPALQHVRSDAFCDYFIDRCARPLSDALASALSAQNGHPQWRQRNETTRQHQSAAALERFDSALGDVDLILIDNNFDLGLTVYDRLHPEYPDSKFHFFARRGTSRRLGLISIGDSLRCFQRIIDWLSLRCPGAKIVFVQYPANPFAEKGHVLRASRSRETAAAMNLRGATLVPPVFVPRSEQNAEKGAHYFQSSVYRAYAELLLTVLHGREITLDARQEIHLADLHALRPGGSPITPQRAAHAATPYAGLPARNRWRTAVAQADPLRMTGLYRKRFPISTDDRIATC